MTQTSGLSIVKRGLEPPKTDASGLDICNRELGQHPFAGHGPKPGDHVPADWREFWGDEGVWDDN